MSHPNLIIFYVNDVPRSTAFYRELFNVLPVEVSDGFAMFVLDNGLRFGVWQRQAVKPVVAATGGAMELAIPLTGERQVDDLYQRWSQDAMAIAQMPERMEFGYTFTALDPDGHRLRVYAPAL